MAGIGHVFDPKRLHQGFDVGGCKVEILDPAGSGEVGGVRGWGLTWGFTDLIPDRDQLGAVAQVSHCLKGVFRS